MASDFKTKMNDDHKNALQESQFDISQELEAEDVLLYLNTKGIVQDDQVEEIMEIMHKDIRIMRLIRIVKGAGPSALQEFINALKACNKEHLAEKILARLPSSSNQQLALPETNTKNTFNNQQNEGRTVGGPVSGGTVILGDTYKIAQMVVHGECRAYPQDNRQAPSTSSSISSQPNFEEWQQELKTIQQSLRDMYLRRFQQIYPFSLPFTFDIENTWVSLTLEEEKKDSQATEDHSELLKTAFEKVKMLIIEGNPATGKTSLMRKLAYEWGKGKQELLCYDVVLYAEFRKMREKTFESIAKLVLKYSKTLLKQECYGLLKKLMNNEQFCEKRCILVLLDGYDESSLEKQCSELKTYLFESITDKAPVFNVVISTRKGYLSNLRGRKGRFVFAEVLGFITKQQKEKYILNHFLSSKIDNKHNIEAVQNLLNNNENLNKLAETPLFLTFICLVHERIIDGTLLELYCNIIWWLIDRHQQDFPDRDIPCSFGFHNGSSDKFKTIQDCYTHFPQLLCLGKMALARLKDNVFGEADYEQFNLKPIIEQVGLMTKQETRNESLQLKTSFFFPHRTIQEFLAAFYCLCSNDSTSEWLLPISKLDLLGNVMKEFEGFLLRIALSDKMSVQTEKRKYYFERLVDIHLDTTFDAFNTPSGFNNELLNWFLSQCTNVQTIAVTHKSNNAKHARNLLNDASIQIGSIFTPNMSSPMLFTFSDLIHLHTVRFFMCIFEADTQLSYTNCRLLGRLLFGNCEIKSRINLGIATKPKIHSVEFDKCDIALETWQSITDQIKNGSVIRLQLGFGKQQLGVSYFGGDFNKEFLIHLQKCNNLKEMEITIHGYEIRQNDLLSFSDLIKLHSLTFGGIIPSYGCTFIANSQLSFKNCPSLNNLQFIECEMKNSTISGIATLPSIDTVEFIKCKIDLATWQSITDQIKNSSVKSLQLSADFFVKETYPEFLHHLQKCQCIQQFLVKNFYDRDVSDFIMNFYEEEVTANLAQTAHEWPGLASIIISDRFGERLAESKRLKESNRERIEKAGQERNAEFMIKYVE